MTNLPPLIRLEVDEMRHSIMHYLHLHHAEVEKQVKEQIERTIETYDFETRVAEAVSRTLDRAIKEYFEYGEGSRWIREGTWEVLDSRLKRE